MSNAFETSLSAMQHCFLSNKAFDIISTVVAIAVSVDLAVLNSCWESSKILLTSRNVLALLSIIFSNIFQDTSKSEMGR